MKRNMFWAFIIFSFLVACTPQIKPVKESKAPKIKVLLGTVTTRDSLLLNGTFNTHLEEAEYELGKHSQLFFVSPSKSGFKLYNQRRLFVLTPNDVLVLRPALPVNRQRFQFRKKWFNGAIILRLNDKKEIEIINEIDLEEYLKCVVVGEMPSNNDDYLEALKAQAICARTYALNRMRKTKNKSFHVYADVRDQVYAGLDRRTKLADYAVETTRGTILMFNDQPAQIFYHSNCGGILEDVTNYWPDRKPVSYLRSRKDVLGDVFTCAGKSHFRWKKSFTFKMIDSLFQKGFSKSVYNRTIDAPDTVQCTLKILKRTSSGRVKSLQLSLADTSVVLSDFAIRRFFTDSSGKALPSLLFTISAQNDSTVLFTGGGYGHGVGLCQWGALNMSQKGFKYYDILVNQYFPGTYLKRMY